MGQTLYILAGIAASGKSTYGMKLHAKVGGVVISSDAIREEICGNAEDQSKNGLIFNVLIPKRIQSALADGQNVIFDATNVSIKARREIRKLAPIGVAVECHYIVPDVAVAKKQNKMRLRQVPEFVIDKHKLSWATPVIGEGFDKVVNINESE